MSASRNAPVLEPAGASPATPQPDVPRPAIVPPPSPGPSRTRLWSMVLSGLVIAGGVAFYLSSQSKVKTTGGPVTVPTVAVSIGDLHTTVATWKKWTAAGYSSDKRSA